MSLPQFRGIPATFNVRGVQELCERIRLALTFAEGGYVGIGAAEGYRNNELVYREMQATRSTSWATRRSWFDGRSITTENLEGLIQCVAAKMIDEPGRTLMQRLAGIYVASHSTPNVDIRIPVAMIGVEMMSWNRLQNERDKSVKRVTTSKLLTMCLESYGIDTELPAGAESLDAFNGYDTAGSGPTAVCRIRNRLTHPPRSGFEWPDPDLLTTAWLLSLEYLALLGLRWLGYRGTYRSQFQWNGWPGSEIDVPGSSG